MRIGLRKTVRRVMLLFIAFSICVVGFSAPYFYAEAAAFLFKPKQSAPEKTQTLTPLAAAPPIFKFNPPAPASTPPAQSQTSDDEWTCKNCIQDSDFGLCEPLSGEYVNDGYGYMLTIPEELQAMQAPPPAPNHGFVARLKGDFEATLEVDASYAEGDSSFINEAVDREIGYLKSRGADVVVLKRDVARLDKRDAMRYVAQYTDNSTGQTMIEDKIVAIRKDCPGDDSLSIFYVISLQTPASRYEANRDALEKVLKRWKELELDCC